MKKLFHRIVIVLFCLILCMQYFTAAPSSELSDEITEFIAEKGLSTSNFSMSYLNLVNGDTYEYNADAYRPVGKLRFLPTHMYFYEEESNGTFEPKLKTDPEFTISGMNLEDCRYHSIILSEETISEKMQAYIGNSTQYLELINQRYGSQDPATLPDEYWNGKVLSAKFLMNCLRIVSTRSTLYSGLMSNYAMVQKADAFSDGSVTYPIVQIRSQADGYITAVAEISAPQPFLLVASIKDTAGGDEVLGELGKLICDHILVSMGQTVEKETEASSTKTSPNYYIGEERMTKDNTLTRWLLITFGVAGIFAIAGLVFWLIWRAQHRQY